MAHAEEEHKHELLIGAGSSIANKLVHKLITTFLYNDPHHDIVYSSLSSTRGLCRVLDHATECDVDDLDEPKSIDFAISEIPLDSSSRSQYPDVEAFPFAAVPIAPIYNLPQLPSNYTLILTPDLLGRIFRKCDKIKASISSQVTCSTDAIQSWSDPDIIALNPSVEHELIQAGDITPVVALGKHGINHIMKSSLYEFAKNQTMFLQQVPIDSSDEWGFNTSLVIKIEQDHIFPFISTNPSSIGFVPYHDVKHVHSDIVKSASMKMSNKLPVPLKVSHLSSLAAVTEMSAIPTLAGVGEDDHNALTISLWGSSGITSWPFIGYSYLVIRTDSIRQGGSCSGREGMLEFFSWFYQGDDVEAIVTSSGFVSVPNDVRAIVLEHLHHDLGCGDGKKVSTLNQTESTIHLIFTSAYLLSYGHSEALSSVLQTAITIFNENHPDNVISFVDSEDPVTDLLDSLHGVEESVAGTIAVIPSADIDKDLGDKYNSFVALPFAAVAGGILFNLCSAIQLETSCAAKDIELVLSVDTVADILNGDITMWNDPRIAKLLPSNDALLLPNNSIKVLKPVHGWANGFAHAIYKATSGKKNVNYSAATIESGDEDQVAALVSITPYSFALIPVFDTNLPYAHVTFSQDEGSNATHPSLEAVDVCVHASYNVSSNRFYIINDLDYYFEHGEALEEHDHSHAEGEGEEEIEKNCYPIVLPIYAVIKKSFTQNECINESGISAAKFLQFLYGLTDSDFFLGFEDYNTTTGASLSNEDEVSIYDEVILIRNSREGVKIALNHWSMTSLIAPFVKQGTTLLRASYMAALEEISCDKQSILINHAELNGISSSLNSVGIALFAISLSVIFGIASWIIYHRHARIVKNNSPIFLLQILFGAMLGLTAIPLFAVDDSLYFNYHLKNGISSSKIEELSMLCNVSIWLVGIGYAIMVSALYVKMWRITRIFINKKLAKVSLRDSSLLRLEIIPILVFAIEMTIAQLLAPQKYVRTAIAFNPIDGGITESSGSCTTDDPYTAFLPLSITIIASLIYGNYVSYISSDIPSQYSEGKWIALALALMFISILFGIPVIALSDDNPTTLYFAKLAIVVIVFAVSPCFLFLPKFLIAYGFMKSKDGNALKISKSSSQDKVESTEKKSGVNNNNNLVSGSMFVDLALKDKNTFITEYSRADVLPLPSDDAQKQQLHAFSTQVLGRDEEVNVSPETAAFEHNLLISTSAAVIDQQP